MWHQDRPAACLRRQSVCRLTPDTLSEPWETVTQGSGIESALHGTGSMTCDALTRNDLLNGWWRNLQDW